VPKQKELQPDGNPYSRRLHAVSEDFRKIGVTAMSAGLVGLIITGNTVTVDDATNIWLCGAFYWVSGLFLAPKGE